VVYISGDDDLDKELSVTVTQFVLKPDIPTREKAYFMRFYVMFSKISALGFIRREDILSFMITYKMVAILLENGVYDYSHELMGEFLMKVQLSRSVGGFWTLYGQRGVEKTENIQRIINDQGRTSLKSKLRWSLFGRKEEPSYNEGVVQEP
jgi:hypothetical protein